MVVSLAVAPIELQQARNWIYALLGGPYFCGDTYTIADIAIYSWYGSLAQGKIYNNACNFLNVDEYTHLKAWAEKIGERPATKRARKVNR